MSNETEGRSGNQRWDSNVLSAEFFAELDAQYPIATWFVKAEVFLFLVAAVLSFLGKGMLIWGGLDVWIFHSLYLMTWMFMYTIGATGIGVGIMYLLWKFFAK